MTDKDESTEDSADSSDSDAIASDFTPPSETGAKLSTDGLKNRIDEIKELLDEDRLDEASRIANDAVDICGILQSEGLVTNDFHNDVINIYEKIEESKEDGEFGISEKNQLRFLLRDLEDQLQQSRAENAKSDHVDEYIERLEQKEKTLEQERGQLKELEQRLGQKEEKLDAIFTDVSERKEELEKARSKAEDLEETRSKLVQWEAGEEIGGQFGTRKEELKRSLYAWLLGSLLAFGVLLYFSYMLYTDVSTASGDGYVLLSKVSLLLPVSILVWFFVTNYSRQKKLMREYEFKESMSISFTGFLEMLREDMSEEERPQIGEFVVNTMDRIYSNPQENVSQMNDSGDESAPISQGAVAEILNRLGKK